MKNALLILALFFAAAARAQSLPEWMAGSWGDEVDGVKMEEHWTKGEGGLMVGMHRDVGPKRVSFEFLRIEKRGDRIVYLAMPGGRPATEFPLKSSEPDRVLFENPAHDFPQRIAYWRDGARLCASVEGMMRGKLESEEWCWSPR